MQHLEKLFWVFFFMIMEMNERVEEGSFCSIIHYQENECEMEVKENVTPCV